MIHGVIDIVAVDFMLPCQNCHIFIILANGMQSLPQISVQTVTTFIKYLLRVSMTQNFY